LLKPEKLLMFSDQKRWIFLPGIGSLAKAGNNGIQEVVGSTPIGSTIRLAGKTPARSWQAIRNYRLNLLLESHLSQHRIQVVIVIN
jgi:hypothetical protein